MQNEKGSNPQQRWGSDHMDVEDLAKDFESEEVKKVLAEHLAEGADIGAVTKHLLEAAQKEAKRRKVG